MADDIRVDKWLWAVRLFKTRSQATLACRKGHVSIAGLPVKPSRVIHPGEIVDVRKAPVTRRFKVLKLAEKRMSAKLVAAYIEEVTPQEQLDLLDMQKHMNWSNRDRGTGRPTKKDRRDLDQFFDW